MFNMPSSLSAVVPTFVSGAGSRTISPVGGRYGAAPDSSTLSRTRAHGGPAGSAATANLALLGALVGLFGELHPLFDQWAQTSRDASCKGMYGRHRVYSDGTPVGQDAGHRADEPTMTASTLGRLSAARHVATYTAGQVGATVVVARILGCRLPAKALLAGAAINAVTHVVIDRREPLLWLARKAGQAGYVERCAAARVSEDGSVRRELSGPGSALMELDQSLHRAIGVAAAVVTTCIATRRACRG
ncbi:hypothetical protein [Kitasatospora sp. NPDC088783]|uniref:hypothetical protein n=1 Tax=Kitasatospora sp. NPDC088783 TaxID=3364077 RepID=UPI0037F1DEA7